MKQGKMIINDQIYFLQVKGRRVEYETVYRTGMRFTNLFFIVPAFRLQKGELIMDLLNGLSLVEETDEEVSEALYLTFQKNLNRMPLLPDEDWMLQLPHAVSENSSSVDE